LGSVVLFFPLFQILKKFRRQREKCRHLQIEKGKKRGKRNNSSAIKHPHVLFLFLIYLFFIFSCEVSQAFSFLGYVKILNGLMGYFVFKKKKKKKKRYCFFFLGRKII